MILERSGAGFLFQGRPGRGARAGVPEEFLRFIDAGQFAHYLVGDAHTSPERPSSATFKLGVVGPGSAFTPHAHGGEHIVLSLGHAVRAVRRASWGRLNAGETWLNCRPFRTAELPHGGRGVSGHGTDLSVLALHEYQRAKTVTAGCGRRRGWSSAEVGRSGDGTR
ncbi:hypothetical protein [Streptomyces sp. NPDC091212]|uniref:hypothetical protein n=1 Tax=Streptomyces sp. NPDC091212 TaxID=3155191 RepID=UPI0034453E70